MKDAGFLKTLYMPGTNRGIGLCMMGILTSGNGMLELGCHLPGQEFLACLIGGSIQWPVAVVQLEVFCHHVSVEGFQPLHCVVIAVACPLFSLE